MSRRVLVWTLVFLALALNPAVEGLQRRACVSASPWRGAVYLLVIATIAGIGA